MDVPTQEELDSGIFPQLGSTYISKNKMIWTVMKLFIRLTSKRRIPCITLNSNTGKIKHLSVELFNKGF